MILNKHSENLKRASDTAAENASEVSESLGCQAEEMRNASNEANALLKILEERAKESDVKDYINQSSFITERLQSIAVDMSRILETQITEDDWRRFTKGDKGIFIRKMLGFREKARLGSIREKYQEDDKFRVYVNNYFTEFEVLLVEASRRDQEGMLKNIFISSDVGKVYMLLAQALGREILNS